MATKAKSGLTAVRQYPEKIIEPPNTFTVGAPTFTSAVRDGRGHSSLHVGVVNNTAFTLKILHSWRPTGPFTLDQSVTSIADSETGFQVAEIIIPLKKRFIKIVVDAPGAGLGIDFEIGAYFLPRTPASAVIVSGSDGTLVTPVKGSPGTVITSNADIVVGVGATVALGVPPANTRRMTVQVTSGSGASRIRIREVAGGAGRGKVLTLLGSTMYGGADGAIASLEAQNVAGPATTIAVQYERD